MKAAVLREIGKPLQIEEVQLSKPGPHEVLIRTAAAGVCHSDLHFLEGSFPYPLPAILGHESSGVVEAVGSEVRTVKPGDHVITCLTAFCGHCKHCVTGHLNRCDSPDTRRTQSDEPRITKDSAPINQFLHLSSFAEQLLVHEHACVAVRKDMPLDRAALIGCGVLTGAGAVLNTSKVQPGDTVAVIGCGGVGLAAINAAAIVGASRIIAIDNTPGKANLAKQFGTTDFICSAETDPVAAVIEMTKGGVEHSFECVGLKVTSEQSFAMVCKGGTANIVGMVAPAVKLELPAYTCLGERRIQGSMMGSSRFPVDMPRLVDFYMSGKLKLDDMISRRLRLEQVNDAFTEMKTGGVARSVIVFDQ
jgi:S-(hydroxymethyl)glutathione dehydrogenase/alcohol dehydrogenase